MDGRTSGWLAAAALLVGCAGCVTTHEDKTQVLSSGAEPGPAAAKRAAPKRAPSAGLTLEFAKLKRDQADNARGDPDLQGRLRDEARVAYQETLKLDPSNLEAARGLALLYVHGADYERAFDTYRKAQARHPKDTALLLDMAMCHNRRKEFGEAAKCCRKALELEPENRQALSLLGMTLARAGQADQALTYLSRASGPAAAHYTLARMQLHLKQPEQARQHLALALRENPNLQNAQDLLASLNTPGPANQGGIVQTRHTAALQPPAP